MASSQSYIRITEPSVDREELNAVSKVFDSNWFTMGNEVSEFELEFGKYIGSKYNIACNSGTAALELAFMALDIKGGNVILPSFTFVASASSIIRVNGRLKFADIESFTVPTLSPKHVESLIDENTKAILFVTYGGNVGTLPEISALAKKYQIPLVIDATHFLGNLKFNLPEYGTFLAFSFHTTKNITGGEGGLLAFNTSDYHSQIKLLRSHGLVKNGYTNEYQIMYLSGNYRLTELQAAMLRVQLTKLDRFNEKRMQIAILYDSELKDIFKIPFLKKRKESVNHLYPIIIQENGSRNKLVKHLKLKNIETSIHYPSLHTQEVLFPYMDKSSTLPITESLVKRIVSLPMHPNLTRSNTEYIISCIKDLSNG